MYRPKARTLPPGVPGDRRAFALTRSGADVDLPGFGDDDDPFIVLTETKFSFRCIPVGIGTLLTGLGSTKKHM